MAIDANPPERGRARSAGAGTTERGPLRQGPAHRTADGAAPAAPGARRLGLALVVISMAQLMLVLDELIVNTALPPPS